MCKTPSYYTVDTPTPARVHVPYTSHLAEKGLKHKL